MIQYSKTEFFNQYGRKGMIMKVNEDDAEIGDYELLCPEEMDLAKEWKNKGYKIASVFETDGEDIVILDDELGSSFHKIAYIIVDSNLNLEKKALDYFKANDDGFISFTDRTEGYMAGYKQAIEDLKQKY